MRSGQNAIVSPAEAAALIHDLAGLPALVLAVSGGPDSTALLWLMARWRAGLPDGPALVAVTVDHGLRPEAAAEARAVASLARRLRVTHHTLSWTGRKPETGLQEAARLARYRLLAEAARAAGAPAIATAHTQDDQAETVLFRMARGSGLTGLAGMRRVSPLPCPSPERGGSIAPTGQREAWPVGAVGVGSSFGAQTPTRPPSPAASAGDLPLAGGGMAPVVVRPLLTLPKARLIATLAAENLPFADDRSNRDPRFTRPRLRKLMPDLAQEGLDAARLARLADRMTRADAALSAAAEAAWVALVKREGGRLALTRAAFMALPDEIGLRVLGRAAAEAGDEGPVELAKLEALHAGLRNASGAPGNARFRRSLAGALVTMTAQSLTVERAPPRRSRALTTGPATGPRSPENAVKEAQ